MINTRKDMTVEVGNTDAEGRLILCDALFEADLIDEIEVLVHPLVLGKGVRLFPDGYQSSMKLVDSKTLPLGVVYLSYQIEHQA